MESLSSKRTCCKPNSNMPLVSAAFSHRNLLYRDHAPLEIKACRKLCVSRTRVRTGRHFRLYQPPGNQKQNASMWFCSHTAHAPAKPNPPAATAWLRTLGSCIVPCEGLKAADPWHRPLDPKVVTLDPLLQVLA